MPTKAQRITGWVLSGLLGLFLIGASGIPKFMNWPGRDEMMDKLGIKLSLLPILGVLEIAITIFYLTRRTAFLGAILITGYLGGAILTHVRIGDPWYFPVVLGVLVWVGLGLRTPVIFRLAIGAEQRSSSL